MDSIKTKIVNASQSTKHDNVTYSDLDATGTYIRCLYIPMGARVDSVECRSSVRFAGNSTAITLKSGHPVGVSQSDTSSAQAAADFCTAWDVDALVPGTMVLNANSMEGQMILPAMTKNTAAVANSNVSEYSSGEYVVPVIATIAVATGAPTSGSMYWWVDYRFDSNIVWTQAALA
jgi:hypothetical protein